MQTQDQALTEVYLRTRALYKSDQVVKGCRTLRIGLKVHAVIASRYVSEGHLRVSTEDAENWWQLLEKVAIIVRVDLPYNYRGL
jgi:hypothetical protein